MIFGDSPSIGPVAAKAAMIGPASDGRPAFSKLCLTVK